MRGAGYFLRIALGLIPFLLIACAGEEAGTVLRISGSALGAEGEVLTRQVGRFMAANPGVRVEIQRTPDDATQRHQLYVQWLNAHVGRPDILQLDVVWTAEFAAAGWVLPLDRFQPFTDDFVPATLAANRWQGRLFALPWFADVGMLYWRTDLMARAPASLDELARFARAGISDEVPRGIVWQGARYEGLVTVFLEVLGAFGGEILTKDGRVAVASPAGVRALDFLRGQIGSIAPPEVLTWHEEEARFAFQNGTSVFLRNWPYAYPLLSDRGKSKVAGKFAVAPMPAAPGGRPSAALGGAQLAINAHSRHPDLAWSLIAFLTAPEQMLERAKVVGQYPPRRSLWSDPRLAEALGVPPGTLSDIRGIVDAAIPRPVTPVYSELSEALQIHLHRALSGQVSSEEALRQAAREMKAILLQSGLPPSPGWAGGDGRGGPRG
ncbi:MAG TPA: ABC transporter substrate-binding protein [Thermoanaerobaculia bacterium]|nr:ABC transporter substrate-binding protein [Thermoanaerobaculia bacterium]